MHARANDRNTFKTYIEASGETEGQQFSEVAACLSAITAREEVSCPCLEGFRTRYEEPERIGQPTITLNEKQIAGASSIC